MYLLREWEQPATQREQEEKKRKKNHKRERGGEPQNQAERRVHSKERQGRTCVPKRSAKGRRRHCVAEKWRGHEKSDLKSFDGSQSQPWELSPKVPRHLTQSQ